MTKKSVTGIISAVFHPVLVSSLVFIFLILINDYISFSNRLIFIALTVLCSSVVPIAYVLYLKKKELVNSMDIDEKHKRTNPLTIAVLAYLVVFTACDLKKPNQQAADLILLNGKVFTFAWDDPAQNGIPAENAPYSESGWTPDAEVVVIRDGRIIFVGDVDGTQSYRSNKTRVIDLKGAIVIPGLVDSHTHIVNLGAKLSRVDLVGVKTEEEVVKKVADRAVTTPEGEWIIGYGWDEGAWATNYPDMTLLSQKVPNHPVYLESLHGFAVWGNRLAFEHAGITKVTELPIGGEIRKDEHGNPTGILLNRATSLLESAIPQPTLEQFKNQIFSALSEMATSGYVAVHEAGALGSHVRAFESLEEEGRLPIRVYAMLSSRDEGLMQTWIEKGPKTDTAGMFSIQSVKAYYDGALGSRGARLLDDYSDKPNYKGVSGGGYGFDEDLVVQAMKAGFQIAIHAIGDAGNRETLNFFEQVFNESPGTRSLRHRIEHAQIIHPDDFSRFTKLGIIASMEPPHAVEDKAWAEERLGPDRIKGGYAWRTLRQAGARLVFNSDLPGSDHNIFYGLHSAITRQDQDFEPEGGWYPEQRMTPEEALRGYSAWAAYASFRENETGTLTIDKWADITVMDIDPLNIGFIEPAKLFKGSILMTIVNGKIVFENGDWFW